MVTLTPTERLEFVTSELKGSDPGKWIDELLGKYERFLEVTSVSEDDLIQLFLDEAEARNLRNEQSDFGDLAYKALYSIGHENLFIDVW